MTVWILLTLLLPNAAPASDDVNASTEPLRYRGIERLLAKFEAEADEDVGRPRRAGRPPSG